LASDIVQEIETLLGGQAVEDLDLEALELAVRQQVMQLAAAATRRGHVRAKSKSKLIYELLGATIL
jgi:hypothetical protein